MLDTSLTLIPVETSKVRDLLYCLLQNISPIAQAAARYSVTDKEVDVFTAEVCSAVWMDHLEIKTIRQYTARAAELRSRVTTLYLWACEALCRTPKTFDAPTVSPEDDVLRLAESIRRSTLLRHKERGTESWEDLCKKKLGAFAAMVLSSTSVDTNTYNPFAFLHKIICSLAAEPSVFELAALVQLVEKETLKLLNLIVAGDTLVDVPSLHAAVRATRIVVIDQSSPQRRVTDDRV